MFVDLNERAPESLRTLLQSEKQEVLLKLCEVYHLGVQAWQQKVDETVAFARKENIEFTALWEADVVDEKLLLEK